MQRCSRNDAEKSDAPGSPRRARGFCYAPECAGMRYQPVRPSIAQPASTSAVTSRREERAGAGGGHAVAARELGGG